jgi:phage FluMu gp28-like protein
LGTSDDRLIPWWTFQERLLADPSRLILVEWARGNGKSFCIAVTIVLRAFEGEAYNRPSDWLIVSASKDQAREALEKCQAFAQAVYAIAEQLQIVEETVKTEDGKERYTRYRLIIGKHTKIYAISCSAKAVRGYTANVWWDEACFFGDGQEMYESLNHCTRGWLKMIVSSTPFGGKNQRFYELRHDNTIIDGKPLWSKHLCDIYQAVADGRPYDIAVGKATSKPELWAREMELQWLEAEGVWLTDDLLQSCVNSQAETIGDYYQGGSCYIGIDPGLRNDLCVFYVLEERGELLLTREVVTLANTTFKEHDRTLAGLMKKYRVLGATIDQNGLGERSTETYIDLYGRRFKGLISTNKSKGELAVLVREWCESKRLAIPGDRALIADLQRVYKTVNANGTIVFSADRDRSGHADRYSALALACHAASTSSTASIEFRSANEDDRGVRSSIDAFSSVGSHDRSPAFLSQNPSAFLP